MCNACVNCDVMAAAGDVLLSINDIDLTHLTYNEAVTILKTQAAQNTVTLRVIQTFAEEEEQDGESSTREDMETLEGPKEDDINWAPLWTRWLGLPRYNFFMMRYWLLSAKNSNLMSFSVTFGQVYGRMGLNMSKIHNLTISF